MWQGVAGGGGTSLRFDEQNMTRSAMARALDLMPVALAEAPENMRQIQRNR